MSRTLGVEQNYADEDACCCVCGDDLEEADPIVWMPRPEVNERAMSMTHPGCAANKGYSISWPDGLWKLIVSDRQTAGGG